MDNYRQKGNELIKIVEQYKIEKCQLPNTIENFGSNLEMGGRPILRKNLYSAYFNIGFDTKYIYQSDNKFWDKQP